MRKILVPLKNGDEVERLVYEPTEFFVYNDFKLSDNTFSTFDIESYTESESLAYMYMWQFCLKSKVCIGRTWEDYITFLKTLGRLYDSSFRNRIVIYVHFLSYEFQFIKEFFNIIEIFARDRRKPIRFVGRLKKTNYVFEFRCSFFLSNMSLEKFCENSKLCEYGKLSGDDFNYSEKRTPYTPLTDRQLAYGYVDVAGLEQCILDRLAEDSIRTIPLTSTSYVRRFCRKNCLKSETYKEYFQGSKLTLRQYKLARRIFRGGNTHASRFYAGLPLKNVGSCDIRSSYPARLLYEKYPIGSYYEYVPKDLIDFLQLCNKKSVIMHIRFTGVELKENIHVPYIDFAHCGYVSKRAGNDNGRVLYADSIDYFCTEVDFLIILNQYKISGIEVVECYWAMKDYIPFELAESIFYWYRKKNVLKNVEGKEYEYAKSKNNLNSIFGMTVSSIIKENVYYDEQTKEWGIRAYDYFEEYDEFQRYYNSRNSFLPYQLGIYTTAYARRELQRGIDLVGDDFLYCDTDSVKFLNPEKNFSLFDELNNNIISTETPHDVDIAGEYIGIWEHDGIYTDFKTLGAKKYLVQKTNGKLEVTVAGLSKEKGAKELLRNDTPFSDFSIGKIFLDSGRTTSWYNESAPHKIKRDGHSFTVTSNIAVLPTTYELGVTDTYFELIEKNLKKDVDIYYSL